MRVGIGYDIHPLVAGRKLMLGGVELESDVGLDGHSDADVLLHAITDAVLGAAGLGDIGTHFPPTDEKFRGVSSGNLLQQAQEKLQRAGYRTVNVDAVVVAERPRIQPYVGEMRRHIAALLGVDTGAVSVKATTNERMGPEGRHEAISAQAVAMLERIVE